LFTSDACHSASRTAPFRDVRMLVQMPVSPASLDGAKA
jgi:hypothetical protein